MDEDGAHRPARSAAGDALTDLVLPVFELNGEFLAAAKDIAEPAGLTPAWWQVLGATLDEPLPVAEIARRVGLGLARQSVQRTADLLVEQGWATYRDNPHHRRAKLLEPTPDGRATLLRLHEAQHAAGPARDRELYPGALTLSAQPVGQRGGERSGGALDALAARRLVLHDLPVNLVVAPHRA